MMRFVRMCGSILDVVTKIRLRLNKKGRIKLPGIKYPIIFRPGSVDVYTLEGIFVAKEYDISLPPAWGDPKYIVDGGANIGCTSVFFANRYPNALIVSIEPERDNYTYLIQNIAQYPNIRGLKSAIWPNHGFIAVRDKGFGLRGFVVEEVNQQTPDALPTVTIPDVISDHKRIDILKLDIEGSEKYLFEGNHEHWLPFVRCLIIELHDRMLPGCTRAVFGAIAKYNFSCSTRGANLVCFNEDEPGGGCSGSRLSLEG